MKFGGIGVPELIIILIVVLLIFGPKNLPKLGNAIGKSIRGLREGMDAGKEEKDKEGKLIRQERYAGSMARSFYVGEGVKEEDIGAKFENGVLKITVPKKEDKKAVPEKKTIAIE